MNVTSNCDVTNSAHQIHMAHHMPLNVTPHENFLRTPLAKRTLALTQSANPSVDSAVLTS